MPPDHDPESRGKRVRNRLQSARRAWNKRHSSTGLKFVLADSIDFIPAGPWDQLTSDRSWFFSRDYLRVLDRSGLDNLAGRYAMAFDAGRPIVALVTQLVQIDGSQLVQSAASNSDPPPRKLRKAVRQATQKARERALSRIRGRVLVCGNLFSWGQHAVALAADYPRDTGGRSSTLSSAACWEPYPMKKLPRETRSVPANDDYLFWRTANETKHDQQLASPSGDATRDDRGNARCRGCDRECTGLSARPESQQQTEHCDDRLWRPGPGEYEWGRRGSRWPKGGTGNR